MFPLLLHTAYSPSVVTCTFRCKHDRLGLLSFAASVLYSRRLSPSAILYIYCTVLQPIQHVSDSTLGVILPQLPTPTSVSLLTRRLSPAPRLRLRLAPSPVSLPSLRGLSLRLCRLPSGATGGLAPPHPLSDRGPWTVGPITLYLFEVVLSLLLIGVGQLCSTRLKNQKSLEVRSRSCSYPFLTQGWDRLPDRTGRLIAALGPRLQ